MSGWAWFLLAEILVSVAYSPLRVGKVRTSSEMAWGSVEMLVMAFAVLKLAGVL